MPIDDFNPDTGLQLSDEERKEQVLRDLEAAILMVEVEFCWRTASRIRQVIREFKSNSGKVSQR